MHILSLKPAAQRAVHCTACSLLLALSAPQACEAAAGGDPRHQGPAELDAVVVQASPLRQTAEQLSQPVEVLAGERLDEARAPTLGDTVGRLPGVQSSNFGAGVGRPVIRGLEGARVATLSGGLGSQDVSSMSQDHAVAIEPFLADQIEVLKGPATLLYGSGSIGGVVNVEDGRIAQWPLDEPSSGRAELRRESASRGSTAMARVDVSGADGALVLHADGVRRDLGDYDTPQGRQANSFVDSGAGSIAATVHGDDAYLGISVSRLQHRYGNPGEPGHDGEAPVTLDLDQHRIEVRGAMQREFGVFDGLRASVARSGYGHVELEGDETGTRFRNDGSELRAELTHRAFGRWVGAIGLQHGARRFEAIGEEAFVPRTRTRGTGLFLVEHGDYGAWQFDAGARLDRVRSTPQAEAAARFEPLSLSLGALWHFSPRWRLSFGLDHAGRAPSEEELFADGPHLATASYEIGDATLREERALQAELGLHFHGERFEARLSAYRNAFDDFIFLRDTGDLVEGGHGHGPGRHGDHDDHDGDGHDDHGHHHGLLPVRQWTQADARFRGYEIEGIAHLADDARGRLDLRVFADQVRATLVDGGNLPRIAPRRSGAELRWQGNALRAHVGATRYARQQHVAEGETPTSGYMLVDAGLAWHRDIGSFGWELFLEARNLGDREARVHTSFLKDEVLLPGRNAMAGVRVFF